MMDTFSSILKYLRKREELTQADFAEKIGISKSAVSMYENGNREPDFNTLELIADFFNVDMNFLLGKSTTENSNQLTITNLYPIKKKKFPLIGTIACGEPILADQNFEGYVEAGADIHADFCIKAKGDSMKNIRIEDGDIIFIREQPDVENGEIAAVLIGEEATLKRVNKNTPGFLFLMPENSEYEPIVINLNDNTEDIRILGKAVAFQSDIK